MKGGTPTTSAQVLRNVTPSWGPVKTGMGKADGNSVDASS